MEASCHTSATADAAPAAPSAGPLSFTVNGMNCSSCVRHVTDAIQGVAGVASASVSLEQGRATVRPKPGNHLDAQAIAQAVKSVGYDATLVATEDAHAHPHEHGRDQAWQRTMMLGAAVTVVLMLGEWVFGWGMERWFQWVAFVLALPVQIFCGAQFYRGAWNQLKAGSSNMDTLVALGSTTAFAYSVVGLFAGWQSHLYFMEAAGIITLISVGHWLEAVISTRAASSLRALLNLAPQTARRLDEHGLETEVPVAQLQPGDCIVLKPGDRVPTDAEVLEGNSAVDESMLTGESLPVDKAAGAKLYTGTSNQNGRLLARVTATGEATALAQIIAVVERAQSSRASIQKLGDKVSSVFVPVVVVLAFLTALWWGIGFTSAAAAHDWLAPYLWHAALPQTALAAAVIHAAAVLIIACPCAMGLATPAAIMAGANAAARRGILIRDGAALEKSGTITAVLFDKTGTLTHGKLSVAAFEDGRGSQARAEVQSLAAALTKPSHHPLSQAIANSTLTANLPLQEPASPLGESNAVPLLGGVGGGFRGASQAQKFAATNSLADWRELRGAGVQALWNGQLVRLGSLNWLDECQVNVAAAAKFREHWSAQGATVLGLAADRSLLGVIALRDTLKPAAQDVVALLRAQKLGAYMVTGDNRATAVAIAAQAGIPANQVFAEVRPERKAEIIKELQARGERVAFVGDGINDAPALEQADLGIAVSKASDVAREAADIILLKSDIQAIPEAIGLAQATLRTIKQNLFWAFFYNAASIPLAMLGFLSPLICAAAMGLSDLIVIGNALRLRQWKS
ncbi:MAG: cation-translocating P-type ATPase [Verrucomicrobiota bacterium]